MKVLTVLGSPRIQGNTALVLELAEAALADRGYDVERVNAAELAMGGCQECFACKKGRVDLCAIGDEAHEVLEKILEADAVLFATPVFCWGFPAQLKALLDRMFCLLDVGADGEYASKIEGKAAGLIVTAGGDIKNNADILEQAFIEMVKFMKLRSWGTLLAVNFSGPESLTNTLKARVKAFTDELA